MICCLCTIISFLFHAQYVWKDWPVTAKSALQLPSYVRFSTSIFRQYSLGNISYFVQYFIVYIGKIGFIWAWAHLTFGNKSLNTTPAQLSHDKICKHGSYHEECKYSQPCLIWPKIRRIFSNFIINLEGWLRGAFSIGSQWGVSRGYWWKKKKRIYKSECNNFVGL